MTLLEAIKEYPLVSFCLFFAVVLFFIDVVRRGGE